MQIHTFVWLHCCGFRLFLGIFGPFRNSSTFLKSNVKVHIWEKRDSFATSWSPGVCSTINKVCWTRNAGPCALSELGNSKLPTFENFMLANGKGFRHLPFLWRITYNSSIFEKAYIVDRSPISFGTLRSSSFCFYINSNPCHVLIRLMVCILRTIWPKYIWSMGSELSDSHGTHCRCN